MKTSQAVLRKNVGTWLYTLGAGHTIWHAD